MTTPEEIREANLRIMEPGVGQRGRHLEDTQAARYYDRLLAHLDETNPVAAKLVREGPPSDAVADAVKHGLARTEVTCGGCGEPIRTVGIGATNYQLYRLAYPDAEDTALFDCPSTNEEREG